MRVRACGVAREEIKFAGKSCLRSADTQTHTYTMSPVTAIVLTNTNKDTHTHTHTHTPPQRKAGDSNPSACQ